jgi:thiosulfate/3-mercaptopyruvate sulfurtransferase
MSPITLPAPLAPLISVPDLKWLQQQAASGQVDLLLLDARFNLATPDSGRQAYEQGHLEGAVYAHLDHDLSGVKTGRNGRHPLPTSHALANTLGLWGITPQTRIVAYDDGNSMFAARAWWLLRWLGIETVQVLDGGLGAWLAAGGTLSTAKPDRPLTLVEPIPRHDWLAHAPQVLEALGQPQRMTVLDARTAERFRGIGETLDPAAGHIPGALNRWFGLNLQEGGTFKPAATLQQEFNALLGERPLHTLVHQCGSGVTACHNLLAMAHAGLAPTRLYAGSWSEWCADPARPVAID